MKKAEAFAARPASPDLENRWRGIHVHPIAERPDPRDRQRQRIGSPSTPHLPASAGSCHQRPAGRSLPKAKARVGRSAATNIAISYQSIALEWVQQVVHRLSVANRPFPSIIRKTNARMVIHTAQIWDEPSVDGQIDRYACATFLTR